MSTVAVAGSMLPDTEEVSGPGSRAVRLQLEQGSPLTWISPSGLSKGVHPGVCLV